MSTDYSSYGTVKTNVTSTVRTKWELELLKKAQERLVLERFAAKAPVQKGEGGTVRFNKVLRLSKKTTADTEGYAYTLADAGKFYSNYVDVTPEKFGDSFAWTDDVDIESFLKDPQRQDEVADQFARSMEYRVMRHLALSGMWHRIDNNPNYIVSAACESGSGTGAIKDGGLDGMTIANVGQFTITNPNGQGYDQSRIASAFNDGTDTASFAGSEFYNKAFENTLDTGSKFRMTTPTGITASNTLSTSGLLFVRLLHQSLATETFDGGLLRGVIHPNQEYDLWSDTTWTNTATYDDSGRYKNYKLIRWLGHEFLISSNDVFYRSTAAAPTTLDQSTTGVVYYTPIFGKNSYNIMRWGMGMGSFGVDWYYKDNPDSGDLRNSWRAISWKTKNAVAVLRATSCVTLLTGATDSGIITS